MATMRDALTEALASIEEEPTEVEDTEATAEEAERTEPEAEGTQQEETQASEAREEQSAEETTADNEVPTEYFGVDLSDLPPDARKEVIAGYQERDKFIQQLLRDKADSPDGAEPTAEAATPSESEGEVSDADILQALGIDPENDPFAEHTAKAALPLAKMVLSLNEQVAQLTQQNEVSATERYWETSLTALEGQYGKLPVGRDEVLKLAADAGIAEPMDAYWRIMGPGRQEVFSEVQKRRAELEQTLKRSAQGTTRPSNQADASDKVIEAKDVNEAMRIALDQLAKERGGL
jgi:hypothetical protein